MNELEKRKYVEYREWVNSLIEIAKKEINIEYLKNTIDYYEK